MGHHGNAILSKFPFVTWENIDVSIHEHASRSVLHGVLEIPGFAVPIHAICIHFGLFKTERDKQLDTLCKRIETHVPAGEPLILAGDFNDWQSHAKNFLETHLNLREAFKVMTGKYARSFPVWSPALQVDRIYFRGIKVSTPNVLPNFPGANSLTMRHSMRNLIYKEAVTMLKLMPFPQEAKERRANSR